jgi:hypothetical protein
MTQYTVTVVTANYRDLDGCDSDAAADAILAAAQKAAAKYAAENGIDITVAEPEFPRDRQGRTIIVGYDVPYDNADILAAMETAHDIEEVVGAAADRAIEDCDWEDAA